MKSCIHFRTALFHASSPCCPSLQPCRQIMPFLIYPRYHLLMHCQNLKLPLILPNLTFTDVFPPNWTKFENWPEVGQAVDLSQFESRHMYMCVDSYGAAFPGDGLKSWDVRESLYQIYYQAQNIPAKTDEKTFLFKNKDVTLSINILGTVSDLGPYLVYTLIFTQLAESLRYWTSYAFPREINQGLLGNSRYHGDGEDYPVKFSMEFSLKIA